MARNNASHGIHLQRPSLNKNPAQTRTKPSVSPRKVKLPSCKAFTRGVGVCGPDKRKSKDSGNPALVRPRQSHANLVQPAYLNSISDIRAFSVYLVTDRSLVPSPAAGITAFLSTEFFSSKIKLLWSVYNFLESRVLRENLSLLSAGTTGSRLEDATVLRLHCRNGLRRIMHCYDLCVPRDPDNRDRH